MGTEARKGRMSIVMVVTRILKVGWCVWSVRVGQMKGALIGCKSLSSFSRVQTRLAPSSVLDCELEYREVLLLNYSIRPSPDAVVVDPRT